MAWDDADKVAGTTQTGSFQRVCYESYGVSARITPFIIDHKPQIQNWWYPYPNSQFYTAHDEPDKQSK